MTDILDEAIYDYKEEKKLKILKVFLIITAILTILGSIFIYLYSYHSNKSIKDNKFYTAILLDLKKYEYNSKQYNEKIDLLLNQNNNNLKELALFDVIGNNIKNDEMDLAEVNLDKIIKGKFSDRSKKLAMISKFGIILDKQDLQEIDKKFINIFLGKFQNKDEIFYSKASIYKALWYISQNDKIKAKEILSSLSQSENVSNFDKNNVACILSNLEVN